MRDKFHVLFVVAIALLLIYFGFGVAAGETVSNDYTPILEIALIMLSTAIVSRGRLFSEVIYGRLSNWSEFLQTLAVANAIGIPYFLYIISSATNLYVPLPLSVGAGISTLQLAILILIGVEIEELLFSSILIPTIASNLRNVNAMAVLAFFGAIVVYITFNMLYLALIMFAIGGAFLLLKFARRSLNRSDPEKHIIAIAIVGILFSGFHAWTGASSTLLALIFGVYAVGQLVNWWQQNTIASRIMHSYGNAGVVVATIGVLLANETSALIWVGIYMLMLAVIFRGKIK